MPTPTQPGPALRAVLNDAIDASGASHDDLARALGMHTNALDRLLDGPGRFPVCALARLAEAIGTKASTLMARAEAIH